MQDIFLHIVRYLGSHRARGREEAWAFAIVRSVLIDLAGARIHSAVAGKGNPGFGNSPGTLFTAEDRRMIQRGEGEVGKRWRRTNVARRTSLCVPLTDHT